MASQVGIAFSAAIAKPDRDDPYLDILFHVNEYTAAHLDGILGDIRKYLETHKRAEFGDRGAYYWSRSLDSFEFRRYVYDTDWDEARQ